MHTSAEAAKDCVRRMLVRDPKRRATAQQILQHEWMRENGCAADQPIQLEVLSRIKQFSAMNRLKKEALKVGDTDCWRRREMWGWGWGCWDGHRRGCDGWRVHRPEWVGGGVNAWWMHKARTMSVDGKRTAATGRLALNCGLGR